MKKQHLKIIKTFLDNGKYKSKHFKVKNKCLYFDSIKIAYKGSHARGDNVKIIFNTKISTSLYNDLLCFVSSVYQLKHYKGNRCLQGQTGIYTNPVDKTEIGFLRPYIR